MTATVHQTEAATAVTTWLSAFDDALAAGDPATAAALFAPVTALLAVPRAAAQGARGRHPEAGIPTPVYGLQVHHLS
jgi:hypothetical protein